MLWVLNWRGGTNSYGFIFSKTWQVLSMFIMAPIPNCCFLNMTHTCNFFYLTQALSKNYNPIAKYIESLRLKMFLYYSSGVRFPDWGWGQGNVPLTQPWIGSSLKKLCKESKAIDFLLSSGFLLALAFLHKQNDVSQKCGRGPQAVFPLSPHFR